MASRDEILRALRRGAPQEEPLPAGPLAGAPRHPDPVARLERSIQAVGGGFVRVRGPAELAAGLAELGARLGARRVVCEVPEAGAGTVRMADLDDPHQLEDVELAILPGAFAVAENGAVWVPTGALRHRGVFVVAEHLALVVSAGAVLDDMHEAYGRLRFDGPGFGVFVSGPSKTADIEQALVIGAHGPRSCTVFLVG